MDSSETQEHLSEERGSFTETVLRHVAQIGAGTCDITDDAVRAEPDPDIRQILSGLLILH